MTDVKKEADPAGKDTERLILEAAARVFMKKGRLGASMQDIADEAGINRPLLHYYFRNKEKLFDTIFDRLLSKFFPALVLILSSDRPLLEKIEAFTDSYSRLLNENPFLPVFVFQEISLNPGRLAKRIKDLGLHPGETLKGLGKEMSDAGIMDMDPRHLLANIMGMVLFPYIGRPIFQMIAFQDDHEEYEQFLEDRKMQIPRFMKLAFSKNI